MMIGGYEHELGLFQLEVAQRWFQRGEQTSDVDAKLFFYYTAFNAVFFYWALVDGQTKESDYRQMVNVFRRSGDWDRLWDRLHSEVSDELRFFKEREPIQNMKKRARQDPRVGDSSWGQTHRNVLGDASARSVDRLIALASILYIVRCNLCHGSKGVLEDDMTVIERAARLLRIVAQEVIHYTDTAISSG